MKTLFALLLSLVVLAGCATVQDSRSTARIAVQVATLKVIDGNEAKAAKIRQIANEARAVLSHEEATVGYVVGEVRELVPWGKLDAAEKLLVDTLLLELHYELENRIGEGVLDQEQKVRIETVIGWIETAATL